MQAVGNAVKSALSSAGTGFYGSAYVNITNSKATTSDSLSASIASNLISGSDLSLTSGNGDVNVTGSNISSTNGDLNLTAMLGNVNIRSGETTYSQENKFNSQSLGGSAGTNGLSANVGFNEAGSSIDYTTFTNSQLRAENGTLRINPSRA